jgi:chaperonin GroES
MTGVSVAQAVEREGAKASPRYRPFGRHLLVLPDAPETMTKGGLHKPDVTLEREGKGTVVALGLGGCHPQHGKTIVPHEMVFRAPQRIIYSKYAGTEVTLDGVPHVIITPDDVLMVED